jgi:hypothetical protein
MVVRAEIRERSAVRTLDRGRRCGPVMSVRCHRTGVLSNGRTSRRPSAEVPRSSHVRLHDRDWP